VANTTLISIIGTPKVAPDDGIVEINANCTSGSTVNVESGTYKGGAKCGSNNKVVVCSLLQKLGNNSVKVTQTGQSCENPDAQVITVPAYTGHPVTPEPPLEIEEGKVVNPSSGEVTLDCEPGAAIDATIYGAPVLAGNATCPMNGVMKFNVGLVPSLAGSGSRRVYVTQLTQSGQVNTVSTDMDNVDKKHECTIASTQANTDICVASAGSISGVCKEGTPVQVLVNGVAQRAVDCPNGSYLAENVLLSKPGENNVITIKQKTPHGSTCEAVKSLMNF
jgi:hypothetical protein